MTTHATAYTERFVRTAKESRLDRMIFFGERSLRLALSEVIEHYHRERNHQGLGNRIILPEVWPPTRALSKGKAGWATC